MGSWDFWLLLKVSFMNLDFWNLVDLGYRRDCEGEWKVESGSGFLKIGPTDLLECVWE